MSTTPVMSATPHNFSGALDTWKSIDLTELQRTLDAQGLEVVENQKESLVGRKALADKTKDFRKLSEEDKPQAFKGLLKSYQTEIDSLTKRAKTAESAFLSVYKVIAEAPDPYPLLEAALDQAVKASEADDLEAQVRRLREENAELRKKVNEVSSLESAKAKAEGKLEQMEAKMEEQINERVESKKNELSATYDERILNYEEREKDLQKQVSLVKNQLREVRFANESTQAKLLDHSQRQDHEVVAKLAELDMVVADLEHANTRVATVERRNELLRAEIEALRSGSATSDRVKELENQVADLENEASRLSRALDSIKATSSDLEASSTKKVEELSKDLANERSQVSHLKQKLQSYSDYDEIKRELDIMKYVEFAGAEEDDQDESSVDGYDVQLPNPNAEKANSQQGKSLEALLALKNKRILDELAKFRVLHGELETSLRSAEQRLASADAELEKQKLLNERLENDLLQLDRHNVEQPNGGDTDPLSNDFLADLDLGRKTGPSPARTSPIPFTSSAETSILPIVTSQRDRFRARNAELEDELRKQFQTISGLRGEVKALQADNLKLYEKVRYMQSYREDAKAGPGAAGRRELTGAAPNGDGLGQYRERYEESMNPFTAFRGREITSAYQRLNRLERGVLVVTRGILGNRRTRIFFICYALGLHALVLFASYECTPSSSSRYVTRPSPGA